MCSLINELLFKWRLLRQKSENISKYLRFCETVFKVRFNCKIISRLHLL